MLSLPIQRSLGEFTETIMTGDARYAKMTVTKAVIFSLKYFVEINSYLVLMSMEVQLYKAAMSE